jgi:hypothetical protein
MRDDSIGVTGIDMWLAHVRHTHTYDQLRLITFEIIIASLPARILLLIKNKIHIIRPPDQKAVSPDDSLTRAVVAWMGSAPGTRAIA